MNSLQVLKKERKNAKAAYLEYRSHRSYYEEHRDKEIQQAYYQNTSFEANSIHDLLEKNTSE